ncbi:uncharacterized protein [Coffea arabica]|uniref:Uncharacterized protein n=1 Tax=Coffea arabica TaxID=13443 RepID=A0ABM4U847_COFAR
MKSNGTDSWCWKSLLRARELLKVRMRKRVEDAESINIWENRWLPDIENGKVKSKRSEEYDVQRVCELIKEGKWDKELIAPVFEEKEGREILRIPLSVHHMNDRIYWGKSSSREYTVKSGYRPAKNGKKKEDYVRTCAESSCRRKCLSQS